MGKRMKKHALPRKICAWALAIVTMMSTINIQVPVSAASVTKSIAEWNLTQEHATGLNSESKIGATKGSGSLYVENASYVGWGTQSLSATKWNEGAWVMENIDATNYKDVTFSAKMRSSNTGVKNFRLEYSLDSGKTWTQAKGSEVENTTTLAQKYNKFDLSALDGQTFALRVKQVGTDAVKADTTVAESGTSNINNVVIEGTTDSSNTDDAEESDRTTVEKVTVSPETGEVEKGTQVKLSCATEGATISYAIDGGDYQEYKEAIEITKATTISAYAEKDGVRSETSKFAYTVKADAKPVKPADTTGQRLAEVTDGATLVMYNPAGKVALSATASGSRLTGVEGTPSEEDVLNAPKDAAIMKASIDEDGNYTFTCDGKYLTSGATGNSLTFEDKASDYSLWTLEKADENGGYFLKSTKAEYGGNAQYIEYYKTFTTYGKSATAKADAYLMNFYSAKESTNVKVDSSKVLTIAQWAGNANYEEAGITEEINGDLYETNDMLDKDAVYYGVVNGKKVKPYKKATSSNTGSTTYYMGADGIGSGTNDYVEFKTSSAGYGAMGLSFRLRASNTGPGSFQVQYSTDGTNFENFTTGTYAYKYTSYNASGESHEVSKEDKITDGIAKTSYAPGYYISYTFDVPEGAQNADELYVRLVPGKEKANGKDGAISATNAIRVDSVELTGSPVIASNICGYVKASPDEGEVSKGSEITLSSSTEGVDIYYSLNNGEYQKYDENKKPVIETLPATLRAYATKDGLKDSIKTTFKYTAGKVKSVTASPSGGAIVRNTQVTLKCATEGAKMWFCTDLNQNVWEEYKEPITVNVLPRTYYVKATKDGYEDSSISTLSYTERMNEKYSLYFGQLHSHTNYSDGAGSCEDAYQHATNVDNLDYLAVTDHSNSFDNAEDASIKDGSVSTKWTEGNELADKYTNSKFVSIFGYEMTWSNGLGHMNTFNTNGFQSRTQIEYATYSTALQSYYATLKEVPDSISQFNHPGTTFGDFSDFAYYDEELDNLITMIEVGNGEGAIGSSGYFPSYQYYQRALDKGWHVAPTNNQDNHKGLWGDANTGRSVVMTDSLTRDNIYDAIRNYRMYATEDNDLNIYYTLDGHEMGSILSDGETGDTVNIKAELKDVTDDAIGKVEVITNGGLVLASTDVDKNEDTVNFEIDNKYSYYYLKVTEKDGDIAVTAPVWVGEVEAAGINSMSTSEVLPVQGEALDVNLELYNNENSDMKINSIEFAVDDKVVHTADLEKADLTKVDSMGTAKYSFDYTYKGVGSMEIEAIVKATLNGADKVYKSTLKLNYVTPKMVTKVVIDGSHYNDYVKGYYGGNVGNFSAIAGKQNIRVQVVTDEKDFKEALKDCALLIVSAPAKRNGTANAGDYQTSHFSDEFLQTVKEYTDKGGPLVACGTADYQDTNACQTSTEINKLLKTVGATTKLNSDEAYDEVNNGGQPYRLYLTNYNKDSRYLAGAVEGQKYSAYSGCTVNLDKDAVAAGKAEALVSGFDTTYSINTKDDEGNRADSSEVVPKGDVVAIGHETLDSGANVFVAGTVFISDFEVKAEMDNQFDLQYLNHTIITNLLNEVTVELETTPIAEVRKADMGEVYSIEGYITAARDNGDNAFFDAVCVQDDTAGITVFPWDDTVYGKVELGTKVKVTGYVDAYQGEKELQVMSCKVLNDADKKVYEAKKVTAADAMNYDLNGGNLVQVTGKVTRITDKGKNGEDSVNQFYIDDGSGTEANIFIDGYILSGTTGKNEIGKFVKEGATVTATGLVYSHPATGSDDNEIVLRVRNCDEITKAEEVVKPEITLNSKSVTLKVGESTTDVKLASATIEGDAIVSAKSDDENVAEASVKDGKLTVTGKASGTTTVTVTSKEGATVTVEVTVVKPEITLNSKSVTLKVGESTTDVKLASATIEGDAIVSAKSDDENVAEASVKDGELTVTGKASGTTTVTVTSKEGATATVEVTVVKPEITLNSKSVTLKVGESTTDVKLASATIEGDAIVSAKSDDENVAEASVKDGELTVTGKASGTTTVTVTSKEGATVTVEVTVTKPDEPKPEEKAKITLNYKKYITLTQGTSTTKVKIASSTVKGDKLVGCKSDNKDVAVTSLKGGEFKVIAKKAGTAKITVTSKAGATATFEVRVKPATIKLNYKNYISVKAKASTTRVKLASSTVKGDYLVACKSSDTKIAVTSLKNGVLKITGKKKGTVKITVRSKCGGTATLTVKVK